MMTRTMEMAAVMIEALAFGLTNLIARMMGRAHHLPAQGFLDVDRDGSQRAHVLLSATGVRDHACTKNRVVEKIMN